MTFEKPTTAFAALMQCNDDALRMITGCESMRFAVVVWCDCAEEPTHSASNDEDSQRIVRMLRHSAHMLETSDSYMPVAGHA